MFLKYIELYNKKILTLDKVYGVSIREQKLKDLGTNLQKLAENLIQHFLKQAVRDGFFMEICIKEIFCW